MSSREVSRRFESLVIRETLRRISILRSPTEHSNLPHDRGGVGTIQVHDQHGNQNEGSKSTEHAIFNNNKNSEADKDEEADQTAYDGEDEEEMYSPPLANSLLSLTRFIEIEDIKDAHTKHRVSARSRKPPAILHVNQEAREEAKTMYSLLKLDTIGMSREQAIYFNPMVDIPLFGLGSCISAVRPFICKMMGIQTSIPRVAFMLDPNISCYSSVFGAIARHHNMIALLHGYQENVFFTVISRDGWKGLKEILVVVPSRLWPVRRGEVDASVAYREANSRGVTYAQRRLLAQLEVDIEKIREGKSLGLGNDDRWLGDEKPTIKYISFAPHAPAGLIYDGMVVARKDVWTLPRRESTTLAKMENETGCEIFVPADQWKNQDPREVGFLGNRASIAKVKAAILHLGEIEECRRRQRQ